MGSDWGDRTCPFYKRIADSEHWKGEIWEPLGEGKFTLVVA